jgi:hypothetical protein
MSALDAKEYGIENPYLILVKPLEVLDWRTDTFGNYIYIKRVEYISLEVGNDVLDVERYSEWTRKEFKISVVDVSGDKPRLVSKTTSPNAWNVVPFVPVFNKRSKCNRELGVSAINDIAYQNREVFNLTSLIGEFLYRQAFNILAMEEDATLPQRSQVEGNMGTSNVLTFPGTVTHEPKYLSPPSEPAEFIQSERDKAIADMYRQAAQDVAADLFTGANASGDAAKQAFGRTIPVIAKAADTLQQAEVQILTMWAKLQTKTWTGKIAYKDSFEITNLQDLLLQLSTIFNNLRVMSPTFIREEWRRIVREFDSRIERKTLDKIFSEIEKISDEKIVEFYQTPADIKSVAGVPSTAQLKQGQQQKQLGTDRKISLATGSNASTKEANPIAISERPRLVSRRRSSFLQPPRTAPVSAGLPTSHPRRPLTSVRNYVRQTGGHHSHQRRWHQRRYAEAGRCRCKREASIHDRPGHLDQRSLGHDVREGHEQGREGSLRAEANRGKHQAVRSGYTHR